MPSLTIDIQDFVSVRKKEGKGTMLFQGLFWLLREDSSGIRPAMLGDLVSQNLMTHQDISAYYCSTAAIP